LFDKPFLNSSSREKKNIVNKVLRLRER